MSTSSGAGANATAGVAVITTIPHIVHFIWVGSALPAKCAFNIQTFRDKNPGFQVMVHDDASLRPLLRQHFPATLARYDAAVNLPQKKDFASFVVVYVYGGAFFDCDMQCVKSLAPLLDTLTLLAVYTDVTDAGLAPRRQGPCLTVFGAMKAHPLIRETIEQMALVRRKPLMTKVAYVEAVLQVWQRVFRANFTRYLSTPLQYGLQPGVKFGFVPALRFVGNMMVPTPDMYTYLAGAQGSWHHALQRMYHQCAARVYENEKTVAFVVIVFTLLAVLVILALAASGYSCCISGGGGGRCKPSGGK
jgi:hypothetical protein